MIGAVAEARLSSQRQSELSRHETVRVVIADSDGLARSMMRTALRDGGGIAIIGTTGSDHEVLELVRYYRPTVLIVDTALLRDRGIKLLGTLRAASPPTRVLTIAVDDDQTALAALRAGAVGHLSKDIDPRKLAGLVRRAAAGEAVVPRRLVMPLLERLPELPDGGWRPLHSRLTTREWEIIALLDEGASTQDIAERLVLSVTTVYSHVKSVLRKLGVHSRRDAVLVAERLRRDEARGRNFLTSLGSDHPAPRACAGILKSQEDAGGRPIQVLGRHQKGEVST
ncbi:MAG: response regulator transcription factor [Solirubrobacterales bacterium]|nr:response regulator transcription factor [Solirubrobacterales bacterium]